ncbi:MAG: helix-turn-helix domain-containing protein [Phycisphaerales bacterium]
MQTPRANIVNEKQRRALLSPARQEIVDALEAAGPGSVARLAELTGRPADGLYFHLRRLVAAGLVRERGQKREGRHKATVYELTAAPLCLVYTDQPRVRSQNGRIVAAAVRMSLREFGAACADASVRADGPSRRLWGGRAKGWLTPAELKRLVALVEEASAVLKAGTPRRNATPVALGFLIAPCEVKERTSSGRARPRKGKAP